MINLLLVDDSISVWMSVWCSNEGWMTWWHFKTSLQKFVGGLPKQLKSAECLTKPLRFGDGRQVYKTDCDRGFISL